MSETNGQNGDQQTYAFKDRSVESILAELCLDEALKAPGDICSYELLSEKLGRNAQGEAYSFIATARRRFERKHDCVLSAIPNRGIRWLTAAEVVVTRWDHDIGHLRRHSRATLKRQKSTIGESEKSLTPELIKRRNQNLAFSGVLALMSRPKAERAIAESADRSGRILPASEVLRHFSKEEKESS